MTFVNITDEALKSGLNDKLCRNASDGNNLNINLYKNKKIKYHGKDYWY